MGTKLVFLRRTPKEVDIFGGEVFIDIDGQNVGKLGNEDFSIDLSSGEHRIKMYKSHTYDTFIGFAEEHVNIIDGKDLLVRYSSPMLINQPGNIVITFYESTSQVDSIAQEREKRIIQDDKAISEKKTEAEEKRQKGIIILIIIVVISTIIWGVWYASILNY